MEWMLGKYCHEIFLGGKKKIEKTRANTTIIAVLGKGISNLCSLSKDQGCQISTVLFV